MSVPFHSHFKQAYRRPSFPIHFAYSPRPAYAFTAIEDMFHMTYKRFVSIHHIIISSSCSLYFQIGIYIFVYISTVVVEKVLLTQRVAAAQLRLLRVFGFQLIPDAVQELHVALLGVLFQGGDKGPGHGAGGLAGYLGVLSVWEIFCQYLVVGVVEVGTYEVWSSLLPDHMITSAGDVFVTLFRS